MVESVFNLVIYVNKDVESVIKAKSGDSSSRFLEVVLVNDNGEAFDLSNHIVRFNGLKEDGSHIFNNADIIDEKAGKVRIALTDQTLAIGDSKVIADISIFAEDGECVLTTRSFVIEIQQTIRDDEAIESSDEFGAVLVLFQDVWDMREYIQHKGSLFGELDDEVEEGGEQAGKTIFGGLNNIWNYLINQSTAGVVEVVNSMKEAIGTFTGKTVFEAIEQIEEEGNKIYMPSSTKVLFSRSEKSISIPRYQCYLAERFISNYDGFAKVIVNVTNLNYTGTFWCYVMNNAMAGSCSTDTYNDQGWSGTSFVPIGTVTNQGNYSIMTNTRCPESFCRRGRLNSNTITSAINTREFIIPIKKGDMTAVFVSTANSDSSVSVTFDISTQVLAELTYTDIFRYE